MCTFCCLFICSLTALFLPPSVFHGKEIHYLCPVPVDCHISLDDEGELCSVLFNLSKAFDTVPHQPLLQRPLQSLPLEVDTQLPVRGVLVRNDVICIHDDFAMVG